MRVEIKLFQASRLKSPTPRTNGGRPRMAQPALRRLRSEGGDVNETGVSSQFQLLASERQLTLDGREEPLLSPRAEAVFGSEGERDSKTLPLPLPGVGEQLELREPKWMKACACQAWGARSMRV